MNTILKYTPDNITSLEPHQVFVFGSNSYGFHGRGAALVAKEKFGAIQRKASGLQGQSYAVVTKNDFRKPKSSTLSEIYFGLVALCDFAVNTPEKQFLVTKLGSGEAGYSVEEIKSLWVILQNEHSIPDNIILPKEHEVRD